MLRFADSYDMARKALARAAETSNLESDQDEEVGRGKRKKVSAKKYREQDDADDEDDVGEEEDVIVEKLVAQTKGQVPAKKKAKLPVSKPLPLPPAVPYNQQLKLNRASLHQVLQTVKGLTPTSSLLAKPGSLSELIAKSQEDQSKTSDNGELILFVPIFWQNQGCLHTQVLFSLFLKLARLSLTFCDGSIQDSTQ